MVLMEYENNHVFLQPYSTTIVNILMSRANSRNLIS